MNPVNADPGLGLAPNIGGLHLGIVQGAVYDAVNSIGGGHQPLIPGVPQASPDRRWTPPSPPPPITCSTSSSRRRARSPHVGNGRRADRRPLEGGVGCDPQQPAKAAGVAAGEAAAAAMMGTRDDDGRFDVESFPMGDDPGEWRAATNDVTAWLATARPMVIDDASDFRSAGPRNLKSAAY